MPFIAAFLAVNSLKQDSSIEMTLGECKQLGSPINKVRIALLAGGRLCYMVMTGVTCHGGPKRQCYTYGSYTELIVPLPSAGGTQAATPETDVLKAIGI